MDSQPASASEQPGNGHWFRQVFESISDAVLVHDAVSGEILEVNPRAVEMFGATAADLRRMPLKEICANVPPYTQEDAMRFLRKARDEGPQLFEWQSRALSGEVFWVEMNMRLAQIHGDDRVIVSARDISRRKELEVELRRSEERFRAMLGNFADLVYCLNLPGLSYDYISPVAEQMLGFSAEECKSGGLEFMLSRVHSDDRQPVAAYVEKLRSMDSIDDIAPVTEYRFEHKHLGYRWIRDSRSIVRDTEGNPTAIIGHLRDFTTKREQEDALQQAHAALLFHLENTSLALVETDVDGRVCNWSVQAEKIFGWKAGEVVGKRLSDWNFIHADDASRAELSIRRLLDRTEVRNSCVHRNLARDGRVIVCEWHHSVLFNEQNEIESILSLASDITVEKKVEDALRAMGEGVGVRGGETFFQSLCLQMARTLEARFAQVAMIVPERDRMVSTLGFCADGRVRPNITYSLVGTPCYRVANGEIIYIEHGVKEQSSNVEMFDGIDAESYMGMPLHATDGRVIGLIAVFSDTRLDHRDRLQAMFRVFAVRAAAEMERHQAEAALRRSEERYALAARGSTAGVWDWDLGTGGVYYSPRFRELIGYSVEEFPGHFFSWEQKMHVDDLPLVRQALEDHLERRSPFCVEFRVLIKSGEYRWFEARGQALWTEEGAPYRMAGSALDIHERKLDERRLLRLNRLYAMSNSINEAIVRIREPGQLFQAAVKIAVERGGMCMAWVGLHEEESSTLKPVAMAGNSHGYLEGIVVTVRDEDKGGGPAGRAFRNACAAVSNDIEHDESFWARDRALARGFRSCAAFPLMPDGRPIGVLLIYADETDTFQREEIRVLSALAGDLSFALESSARDRERQRAVEALRENERMISTLLGNLPGAAYRMRIDDAWTLEFVSEGCRELAGYDADQLTDNGKMSYRDLIHPDDADTVRKTVLEAVERGRRFEVTYRIRAADGAEKWIWERGQGIPSDDGKTEHLEGFLADVTERRRMEAQFLRAQRMESIGTLASGIAHDLNNVLTPILMALSILRSKVNQPRDLDLLSTLESSANRGADMVRQILSFARGVESRTTLLRTKDVLLEIDHLIQETFPKSIRAVVSSAPDVWNMEGDPTQLHQVLLNLAVNSRDAMPDGGSLQITATNVMVDDHMAGLHPDARAGAHVVIEVKDSGTGIGVEVRDRIFDPFFTTKELGRGTGLGLSTSLGIVKSHRGFIDVWSEPGKGTSFQIYLPAVAADEAEPKVKHRPGKRAGNGELVMVVDDEHAILETSRRTLEASGYRVVTAVDGADALAVFQGAAEKPAVVITDMMMPIMDGPMFIQELSRISPRLPVIGASGLSHQMQIQFGAVGVSHFLRKPYAAEELLDALAEVLEAGNLACAI